MINLLRSSFPKGIQINSSFSAQNSTVFGGVSDIEDAVVNIIQNAKDAMHERGTLTITTSNVTFDSPLTSEFGFTTQCGDFIKISFIDNGIGMTEDIRLKIFEPFFTTKGNENGTGIGLNTVLNTVKSCGGAVEVKSKPAVGTVFDLYLPVVSEGVLVDKVEETGKVMDGVEV